MHNILTIDVEEWFHTPLLKPYISTGQWDQLEHRVAQNVMRMLRILASPKTKATFFILGWVAERYPNLVKEIAAQGHEIASHGYRHELLYNLTPSTFRDYVQRSKKLLEDLTGESVIGYRAPCFSIVASSLWALEILKDIGFSYDSSIFPVHHDTYGIPGYPRFPYRHANDLIEIPPSTLKLAGFNIPFAGGCYLRFFPYWITRNGVLRINRAGYPAVVFIHPWELDPDVPRINQANWLTRFRRYFNLSKTDTILKKALCDFNFLPIKEYLSNAILENIPLFGP